VAHQTNRIDAKLSAECALLGLTVEDVLRLSLDAMRAMPDSRPGASGGGSR